MDNEYPNTGALFRNDKKQERTRQPDYNGELNIICDHCGAVSKRRVGAWIREARTGRKFFSLSFRPAEEKKEPARTNVCERFNQRVQEVGTPIDDEPF